MKTTARARVSDGAIVGVFDHNGWAVLVTMSPDGRLLDRRRIELVDEDLPSMPHHHECQTLPLEQALALVERVRVAADRHAGKGFDAVAKAVPERVRGIALRKCPRLPATVAERISNYWAQNNADPVMYRTALAGAAEARGWDVHWYDARVVIGAAAGSLDVDDFDAHFLDMRRSVGPPWNKDHKLAMAAAIVAANARQS